MGKKIVKIGLFWVVLVFGCLILNKNNIFAATVTVCSKPSTGCTICHQSYCSHTVGQTYKNAVYYFYMNEAYEEMEMDRNKFVVENYVEEGYFVPVYVNSWSSFQTGWNSMGRINNEDCCIIAVVVHMHGDRNGNLNWSGNTTNNRITISNINSLTSKPVKRVILLSCYGAINDSGGSTMASAFLAKTKGGTVIAANEQVFPTEINVDTDDKRKKTYFRYYVSNKEQKSWLDTYNDNYDWYLFTTGQQPIVMSGDYYSIIGLLIMDIDTEDY